jgi:lambda family phage portal protein
MKLNKWDKFIGYFSPVAMERRIQAKRKIEILTREYDAATNYKSSKLIKNNNSANQELKNAIKPVRENSRDLIRNNAFANKAHNVICNNVVGWGIEPKISHDSKAKEEKIRQLWREWSKSCSIDGSDFNQLQRQVLSSIIVDGEAIVRERILDNSIKLQLLESEYLDSKADNYSDTKGNEVIQGIAVDKYGRPQAYFLYDKHPSESKSPSVVVEASEVIHPFRKDRAGQLRGVSWFAPVLHPLKMLAELQWTQLMRLKLSASITGTITQEPSQLTAEQLQEQREQEMELTPGTFRYLNPGEKVDFLNIPNPDGFGGTAKLTLQQVASGLGITYESLSGDLSSVNFSSGRMGHIEFQRNVDTWQWHLMIPLFCEPAFEKFKKFCALKGVDASEVKVSWNPPHRTMVNPREEISTMKDAIRAGLQTLPGALREQGFDPETHLKEIAESNKMITELGLILDSDPRSTANGQIQSSQNLSELKSLLEDED